MYGDTEMTKRKKLMSKRIRQWLASIIDHVNFKYIALANFENRRSTEPWNLDEMQEFETQVKILGFQTQTRFTWGPKTLVHFEVRGTRVNSMLTLIFSTDTPP